MSPTRLKQIAVAISRISGWLPSGGYNGGTPELKYEISDTPRGPIVVIGSDTQRYVLGNVIDQPYFRKEDLEPGALEVITTASERSNKIWAKQGFRVNSGLPGPDHPAMVMGTMIENADAAGVKLSTSAYVAGIPHDDIELLVDAIYKRWKILAVAAYYEPITDDKARYALIRNTLAEMLGEARKQYHNQMKGELSDAIPKYLGHKEADDLLIQVKRGTNNARHLTRDANERIYPESMRFQFGRIGPESYIRMLERWGTKFADRTRNTGEWGPDGIYGALREAYKDPRYAEILLKRFGPIHPNPKPMVPSVMVRTAFGTFPAAHYFNGSSSHYGTDILATGDSYAIGLNKGTVHSRNIDLAFATYLFH